MGWEPYREMSRISTFRISDFGFYFYYLSSISAKYYLQPLLLLLENLFTFLEYNVERLRIVGWGFWRIEYCCIPSKYIEGSCST
jgi:hypothetical protein